MSVPSPDQKLFEEALDLFKQGRLAEAIQKAETLLRNHPDSEDGYEALAIFYSKVNRIDEAVETAKQWIRLNPQSKMARVNLSRFYLQKGLIAEAEHEQAEARRLSWVEELTQKKIAMPKVDPQEKIERFKKVIELDPNDVLGYYSLGDAYLEIQRFPEAVQAFTKGLEADPAHSSSYYGLGQAYQAIGEKERAKEIFEKGIRVADEKGDVMTMKKMQARLNQLSSERS